MGVICRLHGGYLPLANWVGVLHIVVMKARVTYSEEVANQICQYIAEDYSIDAISALPSMPAKSNIYEWIRLHDSFKTGITRARIAQAENHAELIREVISDIQKGRIAPDAGREVIRGLQWLASKKAPKIYGDKMTLAGDAENPLFSLGKRLDALIDQERQLVDVTPIPLALPTPGEEFC